MKLTTKLSLVIVITGVISGVWKAMFVYSDTKELLHQSISQTFLQTAQANMASADTFIAERLGDLSIMAGEIATIDTIENGRQEAERVISRQRLQYLANIWGPINELLVTDLSGRIVLSSRVESEGRLAQTQEKYRVAFEDARLGREYVSSVVLDSSGDFEMVFAAPVYDASLRGNPIIGTAMMRVPWTLVENIFSNNATASWVRVYDANGELISTNVPEERTWMRTAAGRVPLRFEHLLSRAYPGTLIVRGSDGYSQALIAYVKQQGERMFRSEGWTLIYESPLDRVFAPAEAEIWRIFLITALTILLDILFILLLSYRMFARPIADLSKVAERITAGDMNVRAGEVYQDEIGVLAHSFNLMTDSLMRASEYVRSIIKTMPTALVVTDQKGVVTHVNDALLSLLQITPSRCMGRNVATMFHEKGASASTLLVELGIGRMRKGMSQHSMRTFLKDAAGEKIPVLISVSPISENGDVPNAYILIAKDLRELTNYAKRRLETITPILQRVAGGDFSQHVQVPEEVDEFTSHLVALNVMITDFQDLVGKIQNQSKELESRNAQLEMTSQELERAKTGLEAEVAKRTHELEEKMVQLERFNKLAVGRELRMMELKEEIGALKQQITSRDKRRG